MRLTANPRWAIGAVVPGVLAVVMLAWAWSLLGGPRYAGVPTTRELLSFRTDTAVGELTLGVSVEQSFVARQDYLSQVDVNLATYIRRNTAPVILTLADSEGVTIRVAEARPETIADNQFHTFKFEPIPDSRDRRYVATLTSPQGRHGNAFTAWSGDCDCYADGSLFINGVEQPNSELATRVAYQRPGVVVWRELLDRMSQYKPFVAKGAGLMLLAVISSILALAALGNMTVTTSTTSDGERPRWAWLAASVVTVVIVILVTRPYSI